MHEVDLLKINAPEVVTNNLSQQVYNNCGARC